MYQIIHQRRKYRSILDKLTIVNLYFKRKSGWFDPAGKNNYLLSCFSNLLIFRSSRHI
jgi:hypothetical protein